MKDVEPRAGASLDPDIPEGDVTLVRSPPPVPPQAEAFDEATQVRAIPPLPVLREPAPALPRGAPGVFSVAPGLILAGRYTVLKLLGRGGMGEVVSAYDSRLDRRVALKRLRRESASRQSQEDLETRLVREAQAMARLSHPNVVAIYDVGTLEDGAIFIAMEHGGGPDAAALARGGAAHLARGARVLPGGRARAGGRARGGPRPPRLQARERAGGRGRARAGDGLRPGARGVPSPAGEAPAHRPARCPRARWTAPLTAPGTLLGTPRYMAPELLRAPAGGRAQRPVRLLRGALRGPLRPAPLRGRRPRGALRAQLEGRVKPPPPDSDVPAWVERTRAAGPAGRSRPAPRLHAPSSSRQLEDDPEVRRRSLPARGRAWRVWRWPLVALGLGGFVLRQEAEPGCTNLERKLAGTWDGPDARTGGARLPRPRSCPMPRTPSRVWPRCSTATRPRG